MFDPRDLSSDPRTLTPQRPKRDPLKERQDRTRTGSRAEFDPRSGGEDFTSRTERAVGVYSSAGGVATRLRNQMRRLFNAPCPVGL